MLVQCQTALCMVHAMQANQEILKLQASAAEEAERSAAAVQAQQSLQDEVQAQQQVQKLLHALFHTGPCDHSSSCLI